MSSSSSGSPEPPGADAPVWPQYLLPKQWLTQLAGRFASRPRGAWTQAAIRRFVAKYGVNMNEAAQPDIRTYATFNDFFTRALRPSARPLAQAELLCPVDGAISQFGAIQDGQIFQAKGHHYSARALLGGDADLARAFDGGQFATIYLSPRDYHRIHMPCAGRLLRMIHVPGDLFSVNPATARGVPGLFARNERVVCIFDGLVHDTDPRRRGTVNGPWALVLVGATIVGSMATTWHGVVNPPRPGQIRKWQYRDRDLVLAQGEEMGRFLLGSTVVLLFPAHPQGGPAWQFEPHWAPAAPVRMGEAMARPA